MLYTIVMNTQTKQKRLETTARFSELGVSSNLLARLDSLGFIYATPIQHQVIPVALQGTDVVGIAQTGTGKTLAFGVPLIQRLGIHQGRGLIMLPTRELALQVDETLRKVGGSLGLRTAVLIGGASMGKQLSDLRRDPHVVIATPGRLMDHLRQKNYSLRELKIIVLDEADRMLDIGFAKDITAILNAAPRERQTMLFSATMPDTIARLAAKHMRVPIRIEVAPAGTVVKTVEQEVFIVPKQEKLRLLDKLLTDTHGTVLVFSRTKHGAKKITQVVRAMNHSVAEIHSNKSLNQRRAALDGFKSGKFRVLIATDIAARGIDVSGIELVINFDLPDNSEDYVHRIGRTGRAGLFGRAVSFATPDQRGDIRQIERLIRKTLPILALPTLPPPRANLPTVTREYMPHSRPRQRAYGQTYGRGRGAEQRGSGGRRSGGGGQRSGGHRRRMGW